MTDADCQNGLVCKDRSFCVGVVNCAGGLPPDADPSIYDVQTVESACSPGDTCDGGAACSTLKVCVSSDSTGSSTSSSGGNSDDIAVESGCGCRLASSRAGLSALALALGALAGLGMRRRKQR
jgi:MYXO-CTERM domain-containing protein